MFHILRMRLHKCMYLSNSSKVHLRSVCFTVYKFYINKNLNHKINPKPERCKYTKPDIILVLGTRKTRFMSCVCQLDNQQYWAPVHTDPDIEQNLD